METLRYRNGKEIHVGDSVLWGRKRGTVVFVIDSRSYSAAYPEAEWAHLGKGFMLSVEDVGLVHEEEPSEDLEFVARAAPSASEGRP